MILLTTAQLADRFSISRSSVWRYKRKFRDFPSPILIEDRYPRWIADEVEQWLLSKRQG